MKFTIDEIIAGWFNVTFDFGENVYCIMATDIFGTDSPAQLVSAAASALKSQDDHYCVMDNEPGAWVIKIGGKGSFSIYLSREDLFGKPVLDGCDLAFETDIDIYEFAGCVYDAFEPFSKDRKAEYEEEWGRFPEEEFTALGYALGKERS